MKKWKHLFKAAVISAVIAMTAVQVCSAAEAGVQNGAAAEVSVLTNENPGMAPRTWYYIGNRCADGCRQWSPSV